MEKILKAAVVILLFAAYALGGLIAVQAHTDPTEMDTTAYLNAARRIHDTGGVLMHVPNCLTGVYREATQHPLYLLMLSTVAAKDVRFFVRGKLLTYGVGFVFLAVLFLAVRQVFGFWQAAAVSALAVTNATFLRITTMVACESLMAVFFILFWYFTVRALKDPRWAPAAGAAAALTFLTKSLGILTLPIFVCSGLWVRRRDLRRLVSDRRVWAFFGVFVLLCLPLFSRNVRVFGTPLYSNSSAVAWVDNWADYSPERVREGRFGPRQYLRTHTPAEIARTFRDGLVVRNPQMLSDGLKPLRFWGRIDPDTLRGFHKKTVARQGWWALFLSGLFLWGLWCARGSPAAAVTFFSSVFFLTFVGWYSKIFSGSVPTRLLYCLLFLFLMFAVRGAADLIARIRPQETLPHPKTITKRALAGVLLVCTAALCLITTGRGSTSRAPMTSAGCFRCSLRGCRRRPSRAKRCWWAIISWRGFFTLIRR